MAPTNVTPELADRSGCNYTPTNQLKDLEVSTSRICKNVRVTMIVTFTYKLGRNAPSCSEESLGRINLSSLAMSENSVFFL